MIAVNMLIVNIIGSHDEPLAASRAMGSILGAVHCEQRASCVWHLQHTNFNVGHELAVISTAIVMQHGNKTPEA